MDRDKLRIIKTLLDEILMTEPSDEELDYDDAAIDMYADLHNLKESMEQLGF